jgi:hypothetical protein
VGALRRHRGRSERMSSATAGECHRRLPVQRRGSPATPTSTSVGEHGGTADTRLYHPTTRKAAESILHEGGFRDGRGTYLFETSTPFEGAWLVPSPSHEDSEAARYAVVLAVNLDLDATAVASLRSTRGRVQPHVLHPRGSAQRACHDLDLRGTGSLSALRPRATD